MRTFLKSTHANDNQVHVTEIAIETLRYSEAYDKHGQKVGAAIAGDYIELLTQEAVDIANKIVDDSEDGFEIGDYVDGMAHSTIFDEIENALSKNLKEDEDYVIHAETIRGFSFWNGNNWQTVIVESDKDLSTDYEIITDEEQINECEQILDGMTFVKDDHGVQTYEYDDIIIEKSQFQSAWQTYTIIL